MNILKKNNFTETVKNFSQTNTNGWRVLFKGFEMLCLENLFTKLGYDSVEVTYRNKLFI